MGLYENIKKACGKNGTTVFALEHELGYSRGSISKFNKNSPSIKKLQEVATALGVTVNDLLGEPSDTIMPDQDIQELMGIIEILPKPDVYALLEQARRYLAYQNAIKEMKVKK